MPYSARYQFRQNFSVSAQKAFEWCTDFESGSKDHMLMGTKNAERQIERVTEGTLILADTFRAEDGNVKKRKLVQLYHDRLSWVSTHLSGPYKYSQFLYEITADSPNTSHIDFFGVQLNYDKANASEKEKAELAKKLCREDSEGWKLLAKAMEKELGV